MTLKIQWMIQKILYWENFLKMFQNGPIRKVIMIKVIFEDFLIFFPSCRSSWLDTQKISEDSFKKRYDPFIEIGVSDNNNNINTTITQHNSNATTTSTATQHQQQYNINSNTTTATHQYNTTTETQQHQQQHNNSNTAIQHNNSNTTAAATSQQQHNNNNNKDTKVEAVRSTLQLINYLIVFIQNGSNDLSNFWYEVRQ